MFLKLVDREYSLGKVRNDYMAPIEILKKYNIDVQNNILYADHIAYYYQNLQTLCTSNINLIELYFKSNYFIIDVDQKLPEKDYYLFIPLI